MSQIFQIKDYFKRYFKKNWIRIKGKEQLSMTADSTIMSMQISSCLKESDQK